MDIFQYFTQVLDEWATSDPGQLKYFGGKSIMTQMHGQSLMSFFRVRYQIKVLFPMDEPETALSPKTQLELLDLLVRMSTLWHTQFIVATYSPIQLDCPDATIYSFDHILLRQVEYKETEHYRIYRDFLQDRSHFVRAL